MSHRFTDATTLRWRNVFARGKPRAHDDARVLTLVYGLWLLVFALKAAGADWDIAWHYRFLRDDFAPPHLLNTFGMSVGVMLLAFQTWTGWAVDRRGLKLIQAGVVIFAVAIPLDVINHLIWGLDMTTWSPTHSLLYLGTATMIVGALQSWRKLAAPGPWRTALSVGFWAFLVDAVMFPLGQQEYGTLAVDALLKGQTTASSDLLALAGADKIAFALGPIPAWVYPVWLVLATSALLIVARHVQGWRWTATTAASLYLASRVVAYFALAAAGFPRSFVPLMLLAGALLIDLQARWQWPPLLAALAVTAAYYGSARLIGAWTLMPAFPSGSAPIVAAGLWAGFALLPAAVRNQAWRRIRTW
jgi:hypothetical protein